jgi:hypothetical protein
MRTDTPVPMGEESLLLAKWVPEAPKPPPGVLVFIGDDEPGEYDDTAQALAEKGFVVAHVRPYRTDDVDSMKTQYDFLKNQYKAIPFFAGCLPDLHKRKRACTLSPYRYGKYRCSPLIAGSRRRLDGALV